MVLNYKFSIHILWNVLSILSIINQIRCVNIINSTSFNIFKLKFYTYDPNIFSSKTDNPIKIWSYNNLYTIINFGESKIPLYILITSEDYGFYLINGYGPMQNQYKSRIDEKKGIFAYKSFHCSRFGYESLFLENEKNEDILINDFQIVDNSRENFTSNYFLNINNKDKNNIHNITFGILGLELTPTYRYEVLDNFVVQLKKKKYIGNYFWYLKYDENNNNEGYLKIGEFPKCYKNEKIYKEIKSLKYQMFIQWDLFFKDMYFYSSNIYNEENIINNKINLIKEDNDGSANAILDFNYGLITGSKNYYNLIKEDFFNFYINSSICFENQTQIKDRSNKIYLYCLKDKFNTKDINSFPSLYFYHSEFNYTFELNHKDLFRHDENYIYFLVLFDTNKQNIWTLGKIFLSKYQLYFNHDSKMIGFCDDNNEYYENKINNKKMNGEFFLYLFIFVFIAFASIFAFRKGYKFIVGKKIKNYEIEFELNDEKD